MEHNFSWIHNLYWCTKMSVTGTGVFLSKIHFLDSKCTICTDMWIIFWQLDTDTLPNVLTSPENIQRNRFWWLVMTGIVTGMLGMVTGTLRMFHQCYIKNDICSSKIYITIKTGWPILKGTSEMQIQNITSSHKKLEDSENNLNSKLVIYSISTYFEVLRELFE